MIFAAVVFIAIEAYLFSYVLIPYIKYDQFLFWDAIGHYFAAWFLRTYSFPDPFGWNPFFFCGYPQDTYYAPIYHYIIALFSFPLGLDLAFKFATVASIAILPFCLFYLARKFKFDPDESAVITFLAMIPVCGLSLACGGTLFSQFIVGLGTNALGLPIFLVYFGKLKEQIEKLGKGEIERISKIDFAMLSLLAASIVLTHFVVTFAAILAGLLLTANNLSKKVIAFALKHSAITFLLSSFFFVPLIAYSGLSINSSTILSMGFFLTIPMFLLMVLGGAASILDADTRFDKSYFMLLASFGVLLFIDFGQVGLPMHAYRFVLFFMIFGMMLPVKLLFNSIKDVNIKIGFVAAFAVLMVWQFSILLNNNPRIEINYNHLFSYQKAQVPFLEKFGLEKLNGRLMLLEGSYPLTPRAMSHLISLKTGNFTLKGLFGDLGNVPYLEALQAKMLGLFSFPNDPSKKLELFWRLQNINKLFNLFNINFLLSEYSINNAQLVKRVAVRSDKPDFYLYSTGSSELVEKIMEKPLFTEENWGNSVKAWAEGIDPKILVKAKTLPPNLAGKNDSIQIIENSISPARLRFNILSDKEIPVLIKISYFPRWKAYKNGRQIKIYQVAPSLMLIYGKGEIRLSYEKTFIDYLGIVFSIIGIFWIIKELGPGKKTY
ncbi:hypothetical protein HZC34_01050 [Candidatus Saganbacteria bacterium]|nr:hypothetical protein [Candidatus Saganbacteria bacterium]